jgi:hypothetical protein
MLLPASCPLPASQRHAGASQRTAGAQPAPILTKAARRHVSGNHDGVLARFELRQHPVALLLALVSVDGQRGPAVHAQLAGDGVAPLLGLKEDEDAAAIHLLRAGPMTHRCTMQV